MILIHFQRAGHRPIALVGGSTGLIGDPSGKSDERKLLDAKELQKNVDGIRNQLKKFLDFDPANPKAAQLVNNYDWTKDYSLIDFSRDIGKHLTVNYMMAKDSVKKRLGSDARVGMSFTEFTYQLLQGYDFLHLYQNMDCKLQMGGSDQWGNITTGTELIRRKLGGKAFAITCPLITKADGTKFGKTEDGNVWLDKTRTSSYKFYQYWLNASDEMPKLYKNIYSFGQVDNRKFDYTTPGKPSNEAITKTIAEEVTRMVHSEEDLQTAIQASQILFGRSTAADLKNLDRQTFLEVFEGVPQAEISRSDLENGVEMIALLASKTSFLKSNGEARRALAENSISVNKTRVDESHSIGSADLIDDQYILLQRGKKNYFIIKSVR